jgi:hypothetical protein
VSGADHYIRPHSRPNLLKKKLNCGLLKTHIGKRKPLTFSFQSDPLTSTVIASARFTSQFQIVQDPLQMSSPAKTVAFIGQYNGLDSFRIQRNMEAFIHEDRPVELKLTCVSGLGVMGYPMAVNLRNGLSPEYTLAHLRRKQRSHLKIPEASRRQRSCKVISNGFEAAKAAVKSPSDSVPISFRNLAD